MARAIDLPVTPVRGSPNDALNVTITGIVAGTPFIANVSAPTAGTEYTYVLPVGSVKFEMFSRLNGVMRVNINTSITPNYKEVPAGSPYTYEGIDPTSSITLYFSSTQNNDIIEVVSWK